MSGEMTSAHKLVDSPYEGQNVWVKKDGRMIPATIIVACGNACRLENGLLGISGWFSIYKIYTKIEIKHEGQVQDDY